MEKKKQREQAACRDDAREVPSLPDHIEVTAATHVLVSRLLGVSTLPMTNVRKSPTSASTSTTNSAGCALGTTCSCTHSWFSAATIRATASTISCLVSCLVASTISSGSQPSCTHPTAHLPANPRSDHCASLGESNSESSWKWLE